MFSLTFLCSRPCFCISFQEELPSVIAMAYMHLQCEVTHLGVIHTAIYTHPQSQVECVLQSWTTVVSQTDLPLGIVCRKLLTYLFGVENEAESKGLEGLVI